MQSCGGATSSLSSSSSSTSSSRSCLLSECDGWVTNYNHFTSHHQWHVGVKRSRARFHVSSCWGPFIQEEFKHMIPWISATFLLLPFISVCFVLQFIFGLIGGGVWAVIAPAVAVLIWCCFWWYGFFCAVSHYRVRPLSLPYLILITCLRRVFMTFDMLCRC